MNISTGKSSQLQNEEFSSFVVHVDAVTLQSKHVWHNNLTVYCVQFAVPSRLHPDGRLTRQFANNLV